MFSHKSIRAYQQKSNIRDYLDELLQHYSQMKPKEENFWNDIFSAFIGRSEEIEHPSITELRSLHKKMTKPKLERDVYVELLFLVFEYAKGEDELVNEIFADIAVVCEYVTYKQLAKLTPRSYDSISKVCQGLQSCVAKQQIMEIILKNGNFPPYGLLSMLSDLYNSLGLVDEKLYLLLEEASHNDIHPLGYVFRRHIETLTDANLLFYENVVCILENYSSLKYTDDKISSLIELGQAGLLDDNYRAVLSICHFESHWYAKSMAEALSKLQKTQQLCASDNSVDSTANYAQSIALLLLELGPKGYTVGDKFIAYIRQYAAQTETLLFAIAHLPEKLRTLNNLKKMLASAKYALNLAYVLSSLSQEKITSSLLYEILKTPAQALALVQSKGFNISFQQSTFTATQGHNLPFYGEYLKTNYVKDQQSSISNYTCSDEKNEKHEENQDKIVQGERANINTLNDGVLVVEDRVLSPRADGLIEKANTFSKQSNQSCQQLGIQQKIPQGSPAPQFYPQIASDKESKIIYPEELERYKKWLESEKESFPDAFKRLKMKDPDHICCNISFKIPTIPVLLFGKRYELTEIEKRINNTTGIGKCPFTRRKFTINDLIPARAFCDDLAYMIKKSEKKKAKAESSFLKNTIIESLGQGKQPEPKSQPLPQTLKQHDSSTQNNQLLSLKERGGEGSINAHRESGVASQFTFFSTDSSYDGINTTSESLMRGSVPMQVDSIVQSPELDEDVTQDMVNNAGFQSLKG